MLKLIKLKTALIIAVAAVAIGLIVGVFVGHSLYYKPLKPEGQAFAVTQSDGSEILKRDPDAKAKPAQEVPKGAVVERIVKVIVKAKPVEPAASQSASEPIAVAADCPPVNLDLSLVRMPDETRRVIVSSQNGDVLDGIDIPVEAAKPVSDVKKWAVGASYYSNKEYSARVERDLGPARLSFEVLKAGRDLVPGFGIAIRF